MSLLNGYNAEVTVYPEELVTDADGNQMLRASTTGVVTPARIQPQLQSGTSSRRAEQMDEGFFTEQVYNIRFPRGSEGERLAKEGRIGAQAVVEWNGERWPVFGFALFYNGSHRTRRYEFVIRRN